MSADERVLLDVGQIMKAHGLRGQVSVDLWTDRTERLSPGTTLITDRGPVTVTAAILHQQRYLVSFAEIPDRTAAEQWRGVILRAERLDLDDVVWIDDLFDAEVVTTDGLARGRVVSVEQNPASDLLVLDTGHLVPLTFVTEVDPHTRVVVDAPEGLFE